MQIIKKQDHITPGQESVATMRNVGNCQTKSMNDNECKLGRLKLPQQIEAVLPERVLIEIERIAEKTGRDPNEILLELLDKGLGLDP